MGLVGYVRCRREAEKMRRDALKYCNCESLSERIVVPTVKAPVATLNENRSKPQDSNIPKPQEYGANAGHASENFLSCGSSDEE